jgi:hypothetical protein
MSQLAVKDQENGKIGTDLSDKSSPTSSRSSTPFPSSASASASPSHPSSLSPSSSYQSLSFDGIAQDVLKSIQAHTLESPDTLVTPQHPLGFGTPASQISPREVSDDFPTQGEIPFLSPCNICQQRRTCVADGDYWAIADLFLMIVQGWVAYIRLDSILK